MTAGRPAPPAAGPGAAGQLAEAVAPLFGGALPVRLRAWDGSAAGPRDAPTLVVHAPAALRRLAFHPGALGLAPAYVTKEIDVASTWGNGTTRCSRGGSTGSCVPAGGC